MEWITPEDWNDIRGTLLGAVGVFACIGAWSMWKNHKAGLPLIDLDRLSGQLSNLFFLLFIVLLLPLLDIADRHGLGWWTIPLAGVLFGTIATFLGKYQFNRARRNAKVNPNAAPLRKPAASPEEVKVNLKLNVLLAAFGALTIGSVCFIAFNARDFGAAGVAVAFCIALFALVALTWGMVGRWPGDVRFTSQVEIAAGVEDIWKTVRFRAATSWWKKIVRRIEPLDAEGKRFRLHYFNTDTCSACGLPRDPDTPSRVNDVEILEETPFRRLAWRAWPKGAGGAMETMLAHEDEALEFEALAGGGTRITITNTAYRPRVWLALILKLGDAGGEEMRALKAHMEGSATDTLFEVGARRIEEARHAEKFCGCPQGTPSASLFAGAG